MGRQPLRGLRRIDTRRDARPGRGAVRPARRARSTRTGRPAGCPSPTSSSSRSPRRCRFDARVLVMDEPTAALSGVEVERLFAVVRSLRDAGAAVLFISHRFDEVFALCQRITVMRDGALGLHRPGRRRSTVDAGGAADGRPRGRRAVPQAGRPRPARSLLEVRGLTRHGVLRRRQLHRARRRDRRAGRPGRRRPQRGGPGRLRRRPLRRRRGAASTASRLPPRHAAAARSPPAWRWCPEDRRQQGLVMELSVERNATLTRRWRWPGSGCSFGGAERRAAPDVDRSGCRSRPAGSTDPVVHALRRQPAEGRAGQVAGHRAAGADRRRADPRHRRRHQGRGAPAAVRAGRRRGGRR